MLRTEQNTFFHFFFFCCQYFSLLPFLRLVNIFSTINIIGINISHISSFLLYFFFTAVCVCVWTFCHTLKKDISGFISYCIKGRIRSYCNWKKKQQHFYAIYIYELYNVLYIYSRGPVSFLFFFLFSTPVIN